MKAEESLLASLASNSSLYWELLDILSEDLFVERKEDFRKLASVIEAGGSPSIPSEWKPALQPGAVVARLEELHRRRKIAEACRRALLAAADPSRSPEEAEELLEKEILDLQGGTRWEGRILFGGELASRVVADAAARKVKRQATGKPILGISTGFFPLDELLNGFEPGLHVLAGPPGAGKTTLALQMAFRACFEGAAALYVSFENSALSLIQKLLCSLAGIPGRDVVRGFADPEVLKSAAASHAEALSRLAVLEASGEVRAVEVRRKAVQVMRLSRAEGCLVVVDYLQRMAHSFGYDQLRHNVSALVGELRAMALRGGLAVLAISSQNRASGSYADGSGRAALDSLKESGDIEYAADSVMCLVAARSDSVSASPARAMELVVMKNRFGETGKIPLIFRPDLGSFALPVSSAFP